MKRTILHVLALCILFACPAWAEEQAQMPYHIEMRFYELPAGYDQYFENDENNYVEPTGTAKIFTKANIQQEHFTFICDGPSLRVEGVNPKGNPTAHILSSTTMAAFPGESLEVRIPMQKVKYYERRRGNLLTLKVLEEELGMVFDIEVSPAENNPGILYLKANITTRQIDRRESIEGVTLNIGRPVTSATSHHISKELELDQWMGIIQTSGDRPCLLTMLKVPSELNNKQWNSSVEVAFHMLKGSLSFTTLHDYEVAALSGIESPGLMGFRLGSNVDRVALLEGWQRKAEIAGEELGIELYSAPRMRMNTWDKNTLTEKRARVMTRTPEIPTQTYGASPANNLMRRSFHESLGDFSESLRDFVDSIPEPNVIMDVATEYVLYDGEEKPVPVNFGFAMALFASHGDNTGEAEVDLYCNHKRRSPYPSRWSKLMFWTKPEPPTFHENMLQSRFTCRFGETIAFLRETDLPNTHMLALFTLSELPVKKDATKSSTVE